MSKIVVDKVSWDAFKTKTLIVEYEKYEHLYNPQHQLYRNKKTREAALSVIQSALNKIWRENGISGYVCTIDDIKKKLNGLRSQYLFERQKIARAASRGEVFEPTIYWYSMLKFLEPVTSPTPQISNVCSLASLVQNGTNTNLASSSEVAATNSSINFDNSRLVLHSQLTEQDDDMKYSPEIKIQISDPITIEDDDDENEEDQQIYTINLPSNTQSRSTSASPSTRDSFVDVQSYLCERSIESGDNRNSGITITQMKRPNSQSSTKNHEHSNKKQKTTDLPSKQLTTSELTDHLETFGKFVANELRGIYLSSGDVFLRRTKRQLQQVLIDAWTQIDMDESRYPQTSTERTERVVNHSK